MKKIILVIVLAFSSYSFSQAVRWLSYKDTRPNEILGVNWPVDPSAVSYEVYVNDFFAVTTTSIITDIAHLPENKEYEVKVRAVYANGSKSNFGWSIFARTGLYPLASPPTSSTYVFRPPPASGAANGGMTVNKFGNHVRRIADRGITGDKRNLTIDYARIPATGTGANGLNDVIFTRTGNSSALSLRFDYNTYAPITSSYRGFASPRAEADEVSYYVSNALGPREIRKIVNGVTTVFYTVPNEFLSINPIPTAESYFSFDGKYLALELYKVNGGNTWCGVLDMDTGQLIGPPVDIGNPVYAGSVNVSPSGRFICYDVSKNGGINEFYIRNNDATQSLVAGIGTVDITDNGGGITEFIGHSDLGVTAQGNDCIFGRFNPSSNLIMVPFEGPNAGQIIFLFPVFEPTKRSSEPGHLSGVSFDQKGWGYVSNEWSSLSPSGDSNAWYRKQYGVILDESVLITGQDTQLRYYSETMLDETGRASNDYTNKKTAGGTLDDPDSTPSRDGLKLFSNNYHGNQNTTHIHGELWVSQRLDPHVGQIPYNANLDPTLNGGVLLPYAGSKKKVNSQIIAN